MVRQMNYNLTEFHSFMFWKMIIAILQRINNEVCTKNKTTLKVKKKNQQNLKQHNHNNHIIIEKIQESLYIIIMTLVK